MEITTRRQTRVRKNAKINFEALTYGRKLVFVSKYKIKANFAINLCFDSFFLGF